MVAGGQIANCFELYDLAKPLHSSCDIGEGAGLEVCTGSICTAPCAYAQQNEYAEPDEGAVRHVDAVAVVLVF
jgi:hypothetical protein